MPHKNSTLVVYPIKQDGTKEDSMIFIEEKEKGDQLKIAFPFNYAKYKREQDDKDRLLKEEHKKATPERKKLRAERAAEFKIGDSVSYIKDYIPDNWSSMAVYATDTIKEIVIPNDTDDPNADYDASAILERRLLLKEPPIGINELTKITK